MPYESVSPALRCSDCCHSASWFETRGVVVYSRPGGRCRTGAAAGAETTGGRS